jgi:hypothetical protein
VGSSARAASEIVLTAITTPSHNDALRLCIRLLSFTVIAQVREVEEAEDSCVARRSRAHTSDRVAGSTNAIDFMPEGCGRRAQMRQCPGPSYHRGLTLAIQK